MAGASANTTRWTNESIRRFCGGQDPIDWIRQRSREAAYEAMEKGWCGPPFDPVALANMRGIQVIPNEAIKEARTVPLKEGGVQIEYNPSRPDGRIRYSIAHELAHTFFGDYADKIRNRADKAEVSPDEWQLEMLCNIGAAELIMPVGSFPDLESADLSIDALMEMRRKFDVSIEALLLRFIRLTRHACAMIAASRNEDGPYAGRYGIDYVVPSKSWQHPLLVGGPLRDGTVLSECTAIGFTAKGSETFSPGGGAVRIECVGTTPFPGSRFPRVLGLVAASDGQDEPRNAINYIVGDALEPRGDGPRIITMIVNDRATTWAGQFARGVAIKFSKAQIDFRQWCKLEGNHALGRTHFFGEPTGIEIASMIAQQGYGASETPRIRYPALEECLAAVAERGKKHGASVHMPRIGCGQAGGTWAVIGELITNTIVRAGVAVTVYDRPGAK